MNSELTLNGKKEGMMKMVNTNKHQKFLWFAIAWSSFFAMKTIESQALAVPQLLSPAQGSGNQSPTLRLDWAHVPGATRYRVFVSTSFATLSNLNSVTSICNGCVINTVRNSSNLNVGPGQLNPGIRYYWMVRAGSANSGSPNSGIRNFTTRAEVLGVTRLNRPEDGAQNQSRTLRLDWDPVDRATRYRVFVSTSLATLSNLRDDAQNCNGCAINEVRNPTYLNVDLGRLNAGTRYYWMVHAGNDNSGGPNSLIWSFRTRADVLETPVLIRPADGAQNQPLTVFLDWRDVNDADAYRVFVSSSHQGLAALPSDAGEDDCAACVVNERPNESHFTVELGALNLGERYYWMVHAGNNFSGSENSRIRSFTTGADPLETPNLVNPGRNAQNQSTTVRLDWDHVDGATRYRVFVSPSSIVLSNLNDTTAQCNGCVVHRIVENQNFLDMQPGWLNPGTRYYWRVRAGNPITQRGSRNSLIRHFTTNVGVLDTPILQSPQDGAVGQSRTTYLNWRAVDDADAYRVFVSPSRQALAALPSDAGEGDCPVCVVNERPEVSHYTIDPGVLNIGQRYYWMVHAGNDAGGGSENSAIRSFVTREIRNVSPLEGVFRLGGDINVTWFYPGVPQQHPMVVSLKQNSCIENGRETCQRNSARWHQLTQQTTQNDGIQTFEIPGHLALGEDWRVYVKDGEDDTIYAPALGLIALEEADEAVDPDSVIQNCIGFNYEQRVPLENVRIPEVQSVSAERNELDESEVVTLSVQARVDENTGGRAFYYWCANRGGFLPNEAAQDYQQVRYVAPNTGRHDELAKITVQVGDGLGYVDKGELFLTVLGSGGDAQDDPAPRASIATPPNNLLAGERHVIQLALSDRNTRGQNSSDLLTVALYLEDLDSRRDTLISNQISGSARSFVWSVPNQGNYRLRLEAFDGDSATIATSQAFEVVSQYMVEGYVRDREGLPLENATVTVDDQQSTQTDEHGYYWILGMRSGAYDVEVRKAGYVFGRPSVAVELNPQNPNQRADFFEQGHPGNQGGENDAVQQQGAVGLVSGHIFEPNGGRRVSNRNFVVEWWNGDDEQNRRTETALFCRTDGMPMERMSPYDDEGEQGRYRLGAYRPNSLIECMVRTRLSARRDVAVDSDTVEWRISHEYANMIITDVEPDGSWYGCSRTDVVATIRNQGTDHGRWIVRAYVYPRGTNENHPEAFLATGLFGVDFHGVSLNPNEEEQYRFWFDNGGPLPVVNNGWTVKIVVSDEDRGFGEPHERGIDAFVEDQDAPIAQLEVYGRGEGAAEVVPGRTHGVRVHASDNHWIEDWSLEWHAENQAQWQPIALPVLDGQNCQENEGTIANWNIPDIFEEGDRAEVRFQVWDMAGRRAEQRQWVTMRDNTAPTAFFVEPVGEGHVYEQYFNSVDHCVPVEAQVNPGVPIGLVRVGWANGINGEFDSSERIEPFPEDGIIRACIRPGFAGDDVRIALEVEDRNDEIHMFYSDPIRVVFREPCSPWGAFELESTQRPKPVEGEWPKSEVSYKFVSAGEEQFTVLRRDYRAVDGQQELSFGHLFFNSETFELEGQIPLLRPFVENWQGIPLSNIFEPDLVADEVIVPGCDSHWCDYELQERMVSVNEVGAPQVIDRFNNVHYTQRPRVAWKVRLENDSWLASIDYYLNPDPDDWSDQQDLYRRTNNGWQRIRQNVGILRYPVLIEGQPTVFKTHREDSDGDGTEDTYVYSAVELNPENGQEVNATRILERPIAGNKSYSVAQDPVNQDVYFIAYDRNDRQYQLAIYQQGQWRAFEPQSIGEHWRGHPIRYQTVSEPMVNNGHFFVKIQYQFSDGTPYKNIHVRVIAGEPIDPNQQIFDCYENNTDISRSNDTFGVTPDGNLIRVRNNRWNFEERLLLQRTLAEQSCWDGSECTQDMWAYDVPECQYVQRACAQDGNACNGPEVCAPETGECMTDVAQAVDCDDGDMCNGFEWCDPQNGECSPGEPFDMGDGFMCTQEVCENGEFDVFEDNDACRLDACRAFRCDPYHDDADPETGCVYDRLPLIEDGLDCTVALACDPVTGETIQGVVAGTCLIDDRCVAEGEINPDNSCEVCQPLENLESWTEIAAGQQGCAVLSDGDMEGNSFPWSGFSIWPRCIFGDEAAFEGDQGLLCTAGKSVEISPIELLPGQSYALEFMHRIVEGRAFVFFYFERDGLNISVEGTPIQLGGPTQQWSQNRTLFQTPEDFGGTAKIIIISLGETHIDNLSIDFVDEERSLLSQGDVEDATYEWQPYGANACVPTAQIAFEGNRSLQCGPGRQGTRTEAFALEPQQLFRFDFMYLTEAPYFLAYLNKAGSNDKVPGAFFANMSSSQEWLPYSRLLRAPHTEGREFYEALFSSRGLTYVDDIRIVPVPEGRSLIHQGDFEFTHSTAWNRFDGHPACVATEEAVWRGSQGLQCAQGQGIEQAFIPVLPNQLYRFRGIYEIHEGAAEVELGWYRSKLEPIEPIAGATVRIMAEDGNVPTWTWHENIIRTPAIVGGDLRLRLLSTGTTYFDQFTLLPLQEGENLISNGNFEQSLTGWQSYGQSSCETMHEDVFEGEQSIQCSVNQGVQSVMHLAEQETYRLGLRAKGIVGAGWVFIGIQSEEGDFEIIEGGIHRIDGPTFNWVALEIEFEVPQLGQGEHMRVILFSEGMFYFDDIFLGSVVEE